MTHRQLHGPRAATGSRQRGVVLLFSLIALVILLLAAVALMRSFNTSQFMAGNIAFKRDLRNQGERAVDRVLSQFRTGSVLATVASRANNRTASNYSAATLPANAQGIPDALALSDAAFQAAWTAGDIDESNDSSLVGQGVSIRYIVDRMCASTGDEATLGAGTCVLAEPSKVTGSSQQRRADSTPLCTGCKSASPQGVVYRLSIRVNGPRSTQAFFQSTFTIPSV